MRFLLLLFALLVAFTPLHAQSIDTDRDGLSDTLEDALLQRFAPTLWISADDCSTLPAQFAQGTSIPSPQLDNGTLYAQATPRTVEHHKAIELHYYHLWRTDCGRLGHALDTEHVAALLRLPDGKVNDADAWQAELWYAAAHEDTVCDASQITRASTLHSVHDGANIWVSSGKHASFLKEELCNHGCGGDVCLKSKPLHATNIINLGELKHEMNGSIWITSPQWPLAEKMRRSDFTDARVDRLLHLPQTDVAWANPEKRPAQAAILGGNSAIDGTLTGLRSTDTAMSLASDKTGGALGTATRATGHALGKSWHAVGKALGASPHTDKRSSDPQ
ncbi:MAG: hypothetical protein V4734_06490 [Terriglobus sp.]